MLQQRKIRAVWLGQAIKELRERAGLTTSKLGTYVGKNGSTISRMENAEVSVPAAVLEKTIEICRLDDPRRIEELRTVHKDATQGGWWDGYRKDVAPSLMDRAWLESKAISIMSFDITYLPGLLQLPEYAESLVGKLSDRYSSVELRRWVEMRMQRQHVLTKHRAVKLNCIIDGHLLRRRTGGVEIMRDQLDFLVEVSDRPNVTIRILPSDVGLGVAGAFELFTLVAPYPRVSYVATAAGDLCVEGETVNELAAEYSRLEKTCLTVDESTKLMIAERDALQ